MGEYVDGVVFDFGIKLDESFFFPPSVTFYLGISLKTEVVYFTYT
jgi:hypothetical protein